MSAISFSGVASGLDTAKIVQELVALRRRPIQRYEQEKSGLDRSLRALDDLNTALEKLRGLAEGLDSEGEFSSRAARVGNEDLMAATADSASPVGTFRVTVDQLAQTHRTISQAYTSVNDDVGAGDFSFTLGGETTTVTLEAGASSLSDLKLAINEADAGVTASVVNDGSGYRLMVSADESGVANQFTVDTSGLGGGTAPAFTVSTTGADALLTIDDSITVTSPDNSVEGALEGTVLDLKSVGTTEITIEGDTTALAEKLQEFVNTYNELKDLAEAQSAQGGALQGSSLVRSVRSTLSRIMTTSVSTGPNDGERIVAANIGLSLDRNGTMSLDEAKLSSAVEADYGAVLDLFTQSPTETSGGGIAFQLGDTIESFTRGTGDSRGLIALRTDSINSEISRIEDRIEREERSVDLYESTLTRKFTAMEMTISRLQQQQGFFGGL
ncbi:MAG TPA: flagellar filament capping protein FliD [Candidatus Krumholzibacteria bacterium]|nr:flagellar filament capping protein FliD [Candidatus Krumholzibacteria bacterium]